MVSRSTKHKIVDVLHAIADGENKVEVLRQVLAEKYAFEPYTAFKRILLSPSSNITTTDIKDFLEDNKVYITSTDAYDLVKLFDTNKDGKLSYSEFLNAVLPKTDAGLRERATSRQSYTLEDGERLAYDVEYGITRILEEELKNLKNVESLKRELSYAYDYTTAGAFAALDFDSKNYLIPDDFADFSEEVNRLLNDKHIDALYRRLDKDLDGRISYSEFLDGVTLPITDIPQTSTQRSPRRSGSPRRSASPRRNNIETSPSRRTAPLSPRRSAQRTAEPLTESYVSPRKSPSKDVQYSEYLSESKRRSASPRRAQPEEREYRTPNKSPSRLDESTSARKRSPLRGQEEEELVRSFKEIINSAKLLESTKNDLALRYDFNLFDAFRYFDVDGTGAYISAKQLEDGLADLKLYPTKDQVSLLFKKFGKDYYSLFRFADLSSLLTPKSDEYARILDNKKPRYPEPNEDIFSLETERLLARVIDLAIENEIKAESVRQRLTRRPLFNTFDAFKAIDKYNQGFIVLDDLKEILEDNGIFATKKDVDILVERFKGTDAISGKISYSEFNKELSPKSYKHY